VIRRRRFPSIVATAALTLGVCAAASATDDAFFRGKTVRINVGYAAGGGFDTYSRAIARHLGRYIPGNPTIVVENTPGAGGLIVANQLYKVAKPDGLTIGHFIGSLLMGQILGQKGIEFDARRFEYVASPVRAYSACAFTKASGITTLEQWMAAKPPPKLGGVATGSTVPDNMIRVLKTLGLPAQLVTGYKGTADIRLAAEGGELAGSCWGWTSIKATWRKALEANEVSILLQGSPVPQPDLPSVPVVMHLAKTDDARRLVQAAIHDDALTVYQWALPPRTPKDRVNILRKAFLDTLKDSEFLAEAQKAKLDIDPVNGEEIEKVVAGLFRLDATLVARLREVLLQ
jgi:tripartite-type tricarboxylate transporter receptor subunit TctC